MIEHVNDTMWTYNDKSLVSSSANMYNKPQRDSWEGS